MRFPLLLMLLAVPAFAVEQPFSFTVTGPTLAQGHHEALLSVAPRFGRPNEYLRVEGLTGFGYGLTQALQLQVQMAVTVESIGSTEKKIDGGAQVSLRWNPLARRTKALGLNLVATAGLSPERMFVEARLGLEKQLGEFLFAINATVDYRARRDGTEGPNLHSEQTAGIVYRLPSRFTSGVEFRSRVGFDRGEYAGAAFFAGPVFGWRNDSMWLSVGLLPQVAAQKAKAYVGNGEALELRDNERVTVSFKFGADF